MTSYAADVVCNAECHIITAVFATAGSEGAKAALSKDQQAEARDINRSLLTLGKVVFELAKGSQGGHVPFRDSLLTRLLKVGGDWRPGWPVMRLISSSRPALLAMMDAMPQCCSSSRRGRRFGTV
jgi:hypothetical protein